MLNAIFSLYIICFVFVYCSYALKDSNINDTNFEKLSEDSIPDVVLVKKFYSHNKAARRKARVWKLKHITDEVASMSTENKYVEKRCAKSLHVCVTANCFIISIAFYSEYNEFLDELEEDPEMRQNINIFRDNQKQIPVDTNEIDPSIPQITLEEMMDDLVIED